MLQCKLITVSKLSQQCILDLVTQPIMLRRCLSGQRQREALSFAAQFSCEQSTNVLFG